MIKKLRYKFAVVLAMLIVGTTFRWLMGWTVAWDAVISVSVGLGAGWGLAEQTLEEEAEALDALHAKIQARLIDREYDPAGAD